MRLIDADEILPQLDNNQFATYNDYVDVFDMIDNVPTIEAAPVVHAYWIYHKVLAPECSSCHTYSHSASWVGEDIFCPHCGAKMDVDAKEYTFNEIDGDVKPGIVIQEGE